MKVAIIGAGLSGLSVAWHLLQEIDCEVTLFDRKGIGAGASGIATGLMHPYAGEQGRRSLFATEAMDAARELIQAVEGQVVLPRGIIRYIQNENQAQMFRSHAHRYGDVWQHSENSFYIESGMTIDCPRYLKGLWQAVFKKGARLILKEVADLNSLHGFDQIVVAAGAGSVRFPELQPLNLSLLKGQVLKCLTPDEVQLPESSSLCKGSLVLTQDPKTCFIGSTYERGELSEVSDLEFAKKELFPKVGFFFPSVDALEVVECRAAFRVTRPGHYLPIAAQVERNVWVLTALGSRGLLYHAYFGKNLVHEMLRSIR